MLRQSASRTELGMVPLELAPLTLVCRVSALAMQARKTSRIPALVGSYAACANKPYRINVTYLRRNHTWRFCSVARQEIGATDS